MEIMSKLLVVIHLPHYRILEYILLLDYNYELPIHYVDNL